MSMFEKYVDKAKEKAVEWDVEGKAEKFGVEVVRVAGQAKDKAATVADDHKDKVAVWLDKAGAKVDEKTKGQYAEHVAKTKEQINKGVGKLAEQRPGGATGAGAASAGMPQDAPPGEWTASGPTHQEPYTQTSRDTTPPPHDNVG